jgi:pilus assembly protein CpaE
MLTAGIATSDSHTSGQLLAALQQTGLVGSVKQWTLPLPKLPDGSEAMPDLVLLDLGRDPEPYFVFGAHVRRLRPAIRLIACSATYPPDHALLLAAMRSGVQDFIAKPVTADALRDVVARFYEEGRPTETRSAEKLIVLMGSKGGVGTTTVAVNLGVQLCTFAKKRVVLLDFARPLGNVHLLLDLHPRFGIRDAVDSLDRLDTHFFGGLLTRHKTKLEILGGALQPEEWQNIPLAPVQRVVNVAQTGFDTVLMDIGTQFSSDWSPVLQKARLILVVAEANILSLWTLERRLAALSGFGVESDRIRVIINRSHKGDEEALKSIEKNIKKPVFACLPNDYRKASTAANMGLPLMENHNNILSDRYRHLASQLAGIEFAPAVKKPGLSGLFTFPAKR